MNDLYLELANTTLGQLLTQSLKLPKPVPLQRSEHKVLAPPQGSVLIAATKNNLAQASIFKSLIHDDSTVYSIRASKSGFVSIPAAFKAEIKEIHQEHLTNHTFKAFVFDASGFESINDIFHLYELFKLVVGRMEANGKMVIIARDTQNSAHFEQASNVEQPSVQGALIGFCKSIAKETGKKGITCNVLCVQKGAQKYLQSSLYFFLSSKSAFITGQCLKLTNNALQAGKINWLRPLLGKTAIVTGAAQGIGYETAKILARDGAKVVCLDIPANKEKITKLSEEINGHYLAIDLADSNAPQALLDAISSQLGVIDIIVHNAGITRDKTLAKMPDHFWQQVIDINLNKVIQINKGLFQKKIFNDNARIICISSISGIAGNFGQSNYAASKAGIVSYVKSLSQNELIKQNKGMTVNAIAPGFIETSMTKNIPLLTREFGRRMNSLSQGGLPLDIAEGISFLCHPASQAISGNILRICGQSLLGK